MPFLGNTGIEGVEERMELEKLIQLLELEIHV